ncbi:MAG: MerC domain-containing protein [Myxococcota bacterium]
MSVGSAIESVPVASREEADAVVQEPKAESALLDRFGAFLGIACAIHCIVVPLALGVLPTLGLGFLAHEGVDLAIVATASLAAVVAAWLGWRTHRDARIVLGFVASIGLLVLAHAIGESHVGARALSVCGGIGLAATHFWNTRRSRSCKVPGASGHQGHAHS